MLSTRGTSCVAALLLAAAPGDVASAALRVPAVRLAPAIPVAAKGISPSRRAFLLPALKPLWLLSRAASLGPLLRRGLDLPAQAAHSQPRAAVSIPIEERDSGETPTLRRAEARRSLSTRINDTRGELDHARKKDTTAAHLDGLFERRTERTSSVLAWGPGLRAAQAADTYRGDRIRLPSWAAEHAEASSKAELISVPGTPFVRVGSSLIDSKTKGGRELLDSLATMGEGGLVIGSFNSETGEVINAFAWGRDGMTDHRHVLTPESDRATVGGFTFIMKPDGSYLFKGSGSLYKPLTGRVQRAILRHLGVSPAGENWAGKAGRRLRRGLDFMLPL